MKTQLKSAILFGEVLFLVAQLPVIAASATSFGEDLALLRECTEIIELGGPEGSARVAVAPKFQGNVMTGTLDGDTGYSNGWIARDAMRADRDGDGGDFGGEDRWWIGPLGGQFSFYYQQIQPLDEGNWAVPAVLGAEPMEVVSVADDRVHLRKNFSLVNFIGTRFDLCMDRWVRLLTAGEAEACLDTKLTGFKVVAFESRHRLTNMGDRAWAEATGLPSIWSLGMFPGSKAGVVIIPTGGGLRRSQVPVYLSRVGEDRLAVTDKALLYRADGRMRNKIGIPREFCGRIFASYNPERALLTLVQYAFDPDARRYFNSRVSFQDNPYQGEPVQIYNDGTAAQDGSASFYELESTSSMKELEPGQSLHHWHRVFHVSGNEEALDGLAKDLLDMGIIEAERTLRSAE